MNTCSRTLALIVTAASVSHALPASAEATAPPSADAAPPPTTAASPSAAPVPPPAVDPATPPPGQWVYTTQYGWLWMPYADAYTYVPADGWGQPYQYVYGPGIGWSWVIAPWVWGLGPWPHFGFVGPVHFWWWGQGWWRSPWRWHLVPAPAHGPGFFRAPARPGRGFVHREIRPAPMRAPHGGR